MKDKKYAYVFALSGMGEFQRPRIHWSSETAESLLNRVNPEEKEKVQEFIDLAQPGYHLPLDSGDLIFQMAA